MSWTFLTNHAHLLLAVARDPDARVRDLAGRVGISDRAALTILEDLERAGYLERERVGRRNRYTIHPHLPFRHPTTASHDVDELLAIFTGPGPDAADPAGRDGAAPVGRDGAAPVGRDGAERPPVTDRSAPQGAPRDSPRPTS